MGAGDFEPKTVRYAFYVREGEKCFRCGRWLRWEDRGIGWSAHHRKPRGMGGTTDRALAGFANCLILCGSGVTGCHGLTEAHRDTATDLGLLIPRNAVGPEFDPVAVPVQRMDGSWWLLTDTGRAVEVEKGYTR